MSFKKVLTPAAVAIGLVVSAAPAVAAKHYGPGVTDTEIKIGQTMPYSGPASAYGQIGKAEAAYIKMVNEEGGINGRKIVLMSLDDGYSPPKTVEQTRKLVEEDQVLFMFGGLGTPTSTAVHKYLNAKKVPQLFLATGATKWGDPKHFHWTMGWQPSYQQEAKIYAADILKNHPHAKIGVLYQNDDYGKDYLKGLVDGLGAKAKTMIVKEVSYETSEPTVDSQIVQLKGSGADVFVNITTPKFAAQAIRQAYDIGWHPVQYLNNVSNSTGAVLKPAGLEKAKGVISTAYIKDASDKQWDNDADMIKFQAWMKKYMPNDDPANNFNPYGYTVAQTLVHVLKACGDDLTRANVMKQAASIHHLKLPMLLPGITINTSPTDYYPLEQLQLERFDGQNWELYGNIMGK
ncbi:MAG TPA: ABC transporter substrate-binding protein [Burkholderiales bacterium]|nr:ABC transporter substrate-binding protein [Burkholderiales bacterium]